MDRIVVVKLHHSAKIHLVLCLRDQVIVSQRMLFPIKAPCC